MDIAIAVKRKGTDKDKAKGRGTCYGTTYTSQTRDQQRFTISKVAADSATVHYVAIHCPC